MYKQQRNYENIQKMLFDGVGQYDMAGIRDKTIDEIRVDVYHLFLIAEHAFKESGSGKQKMKYVVSQARRLLPSWLQYFITDEFLESVIEKWFQAVKDLLDDGKMNGSDKEEVKEE